MDATSELTLHRFSDSAVSLENPRLFALAAGELHGQLLRESQTAGLTLHSRMLARLNKLVRLSAITESEAKHLTLIAEMAFGECLDEKRVRDIRFIYEKLLDDPKSSPATLVIAGVATNSTSSVQNQKGAAPIDRPHWGDIAGATLGTLGGVLVGGLGGGLIGGVIGGAVGSSD